MIELAAKIVVGALGLHALVKFVFLLVLPYHRRRASLDRAYGEKATATPVSDAALLAVTMLTSAFLAWRGIEPVSFLGGLWIGATLIQLYFHRFHDPLPPELAAPPIVSPIKMMSYAIQARPMRAWREMLVMAALIVFALGLISGGGPAPERSTRATRAHTEIETANPFEGRIMPR